MVNIGGARTLGTAGKNDWALFLTTDLASSEQRLLEQYIILFFKQVIQFDTLTLRLEDSNISAIKDQW